MIPASAWSQKVQNGHFTKRISYDGTTAGQHNHWLEGQNSLGQCHWLLTVQQLHPVCWSSDSWWGKSSTAQQAATRCPQHCNRTMTSAEHDKRNKGRPLLNHTAQLVPIMPLVSGEAHRKRCKVIKRAGFAFSGRQKGWQMGWLYSEVKLLNEVCGSVLNEEMHSAAWNMVFLFASPVVPGPVLSQRTF